jgi:hypothetical protein
MACIQTVYALQKPDAPEVLLHILVALYVATLALLCLASRRLYALLHDLGDPLVFSLAKREPRYQPGESSKRRRSANATNETTAALTSMSSSPSCWLMHRSTFFLLLSCISPANSSSSRMK